jgi:hypothetical protein
MKSIFKLLSLFFLSLLCFACPRGNKCVPPREVTVSNLTTNSALVSWTPVPGVSTYRVVLSKRVDTSFQVVLTQDVNETSLPLSNLEAGAEYKVDVSSICPDGTVSPARSSIFQLPIVIIDDIVFNDGGQIKQQGCSGKTSLYINQIMNSSGSANGQSLSLQNGQAMRLKIRPSLNQKAELMVFTIVRGYPLSPNRAMWTILRDQCEKNAPVLATELVKTTPGLVEKLVCSRQNQRIEIECDKSKPTSFILRLPPNAVADIEVFQKP